MNLKDLFKSIQTLLIVVLAVLLFFSRSCSSTPPVDSEIITEIVTQWDTVKVTEKEYIPKYIRKTVINIDTFQTPIDTISILKDYYAKYFYPTYSSQQLQLIILFTSTKGNFTEVFR